jgi:hypothetical protein
VVTVPHALGRNVMVVAACGRGGSLPPGGQEAKHKEGTGNQVNFQCPQ